METRQSIEDDYVEEVVTILLQQNYHPEDIDHIVKIGRIFYNKGYQVGLEKGWALERTAESL